MSATRHNALSRLSSFLVALITVLALSACGGAGTPEVEETPDEPAESQVDSATLEAYTAQVSELWAQPVSGFVVLRSFAPKYSTLEEARAAADAVPHFRTVDLRTTTGTAGFVAHEVVADHGDVVEVRNSANGDDHCARSGYQRSELVVTGFARKKDLVPVLASEHREEFPDGTLMIFKPGSPVVFQKTSSSSESSADSLTPRAVAVNHVHLPIDLDSAELGLGYQPAELYRNPMPDMQMDASGMPVQQESGPYLHRWDEVQLNGQPVLSEENSEYIDELRIDYPLNEVRKKISTQGGQTLVATGDKCLWLKVNVASSAVHDRQYEGGGGAMVSMGGGRGGGLGRGATPPKKPAPPEYHLPVEGRLVWDSGDSGLEAGVITRSFPVTSLDENRCFESAVGFDRPICLDQRDFQRDCRKLCREQGLCTPSEDQSQCVAGSEGDCRKLCKREGLCTFQNGQCVAATEEECKQAYVCRAADKRCMPHEGQCVHNPNPDCAASEECVDKGQCEANEWGRCVATSSEACAATDACAKLGRCSLHREQCVVTSDQDCRGSTACAEEGACSLQEVEPSALGALATGSKEGQSDPLQSYCAPASDADCKSSPACQKKGWCKRKKTTEKVRAMPRGAKSPAGRKDQDRAIAMAAGEVAITGRWMCAK